MSLSYTKTPHGFEVFDGPHKLAVIYACQQVTDTKLMTGPEAADYSGPKGVAIYKPMKHEDWTIHLTSPSLKLDKLSEIVTGIPTSVGGGLLLQGTAQLIPTQAG